MIFIVTLLHDVPNVQKSRYGLQIGFFPDSKLDILNYAQGSQDALIAARAAILI